MSSPLEAAAERFLKSLRPRGYSPRTLEGYRYTLHHLLKGLAAQGIHTPQDVTPAALWAYQTDLATKGGAHGRPLTVGAQANIVGHVKMFFRFLLRAGSILTNPTLDFQVGLGPRRPPRDILDHAGVRKLLLAPNVAKRRGIRDRAILELMYSTGLRASELINLTVGDIDTSCGELDIRHGKGGKTRRVPVGKAACIWVDHYLKDVRPKLMRRPDETTLFLTRRGRRFDRKALSEMVRTQARKAGLTIVVTPHVIRHTFATHMLKGKANLRHLQEMLGHKKLNTTQIYTHVDITDLKEVHRRCHPRGKE